MTTYDLKKAHYREVSAEGLILNMPPICFFFQLLSINKYLCLNQGVGVLFRFVIQVIRLFKKYRFRYILLIVQEILCDKSAVSLCRLQHLLSWWWERSRLISFYNVYVIITEYKWISTCWRHDMETLSALESGNPPVTGGFSPKGQ